MFRYFQLIIVVNELHGHKPKYTIITNNWMMSLTSLIKIQNGKNEHSKMDIFNVCWKSRFYTVKLNKYCICTPVTAHQYNFI